MRGVGKGVSEGRAVCEPGVGRVVEGFLAKQIGKGKGFTQFCVSLKLLPTGHRQSICR